MSIDLDQIRKRSEAWLADLEGVSPRHMPTDAQLARDVLALVEVAEAAEDITVPVRGLIFEANAFSDPVALAEAKLPIVDRLARLEQALANLKEPA